MPDISLRNKACATFGRGKDQALQRSSRSEASTIDTESSARLNRKERETLRELCTALFPSRRVDPDPHGFYARSALDLGLDEEVARIVETYFSPTQREDFRRLLRTVERPVANLLLAGRPKRFTHMGEDERERYLLGWAHSRLAVKRQGFHALKRLVLFLAYAKVSEDGRNPNWPAVGYQGPKDEERALYRHPGDLRIDPIRPERETTLDTDVCVVGSGAGGSVIAAKLAQAGHNVVVLEAGPYRTADDFTQLEADAYDRMFQGHGLMTTYDLAFGVLAGQTAGGSTTINWMTCLRPPLWAREEWERDHGMAGVTSPAFDAILDEIWQRLNVNTEESLVNPSNEVLRRGCEKLGYRPGIDYYVIPRNAKGCQGRCDFCFFGCIYGAKQSALVTYLPDAYHAGARFLFNTKADHVTIERGAAHGVEATYREDGREVPLHIRSRAVVAAGGALQTPPLLWRSGVRFPGVGLGLRIDPTTAIVGEFEYPIRNWQGPMQTIAVDRFRDTDEGHHGPWIETAPGHPGLSALAVPWLGGKAHKDAMHRIDRSAASIVLVRDVAEGSVATDARGEPVVRYRLSERDRRNLVRGIQETARIHRAAGALRISTLHLKGCTVGDGKTQIGNREFENFLERVQRLGIRENGLALFTAHPMGSARAGRSSRSSTANPTGECHEVRNLWIGDGSILPTAPGVNPMIAIMALAARTAGFVHERLREGR